MWNEAKDLERRFGGKRIRWLLWDSCFQVTWFPWCIYSSCVLPWLCPSQLLLVVSDSPGPALYPNLFTAVSTLLGSRTLIVTEPVVTVSVCTLCVLSPHVMCVSPLQPQKKVPVAWYWNLSAYLGKSFCGFQWQRLRQSFQSMLLGSQFNLCTNIQ